jgi:hypothetical protein
MSNVPPFVSPSTKNWLGMARETVVGTAVLPTVTIPLDKGTYEPEDLIKYLPDEAIRGYMALMYAEIQGVEDASFNYGGPVFGDVYGYFLDNAFGDLSTSGQAAIGGTSNTSAASSAGNTNVTVASSAGFAASQNVQIDIGTLAEVVKLSAAAGSTLTFTGYPLRFNHANNATVQTVSGSYTHRFNILNSGTGQPPTHTATDYTALTTTVGARAYPSLCVAQLDFTGSAEALFMAKVTGNSWISQPAASTPTNNTNFVVPIPAWRTNLTIGSSAIYDIGQWAVAIKRQLQVYWTNQGFQNPYIIARGTLDATATLDFSVAYDETALLQFLNNTQPSVVINVDNGLSGTSHINYTFVLAQGAFVKSKISRSGVLVGYNDDVQAVANTSNVGGSGGLGPITVIVTNNYAPY